MFYASKGLRCFFSRGRLAICAGGGAGLSLQLSRRQLALDEYLIAVEDFPMLGPLVLGACMRRWKELALRSWQRLIQLARSHTSPGAQRRPIVGA